MEFLVPEKYQSDVDDSIRSFKAVLIPWDPSEPIQDVVIPQGPQRALSAMLDYAKERFAENKLNATQRDKFKKDIKEQAEKEHKLQTPDANDAQWEKLADMTLCEVVPLLPQSQKSLFLNVNLVCDDKAVAKDLPINPRAGSIANECGTNIMVRGDVFLCRQFDNENGFYRLDFTTKDLSSPDSIWMNIAKAIRLEDTNLQIKTSKDLKDQGNTLFQAAKFQEALAKYSQALALLPDRTDQKLLRAQIHSNMSACRLKLGDAEGALREADASLATYPAWIKAHGRRGEALKALGRLEEAEQAMNLMTKTPTSSS